MNRITTLNDKLTQEVMQARAKGATATEIGDALQITPQAVAKRFGTLAATQGRTGRLTGQGGRTSRTQRVTGSQMSTGRRTRTGGGRSGRLGR